VVITGAAGGIGSALTAALKDDYTVVELDRSEAAMRSLHDVRGMARDRNIEIAHSNEPGLPPFLGEEQRVRQIFVNLQSNAIKFSHDGGAVSVAVRRNEAGVLAPFGQADTGLGRRYVGIGLTERLTGLHGGGFTLDAHKGGGTIATVRFPPARFLSQDALVDRV
jgi:signal transduction histidine kinase